MNSRHGMLSLTLSGFIWLVFSTSTMAQTSLPPHHPHRLVVKFKSQSALLRQIQSELATRQARRLPLAQLRKAGGAVALFRQNHRVTELTALAPVSLNRSLAAGVDRLFALTLANDASLPDALSRLNADPDIEYAEPDYIGQGAGIETSGNHRIGDSRTAGAMLFPNDPLFINQWGLLNFGQMVGGVTGLAGADINAVPAWDITTGDSTLILAVLDSGIPAGTGEFTGRLMRGHDYVNKDDDPTDDHGHGSNVTGIAAATGNNGRLIAGVDWRCRVLPMKILNDKNLGYYIDWMAAVMAAADSGARVINMSVGGTGYSQGLQDAVTYAVAKGAIVVVSMMNKNAETPFYPAAFPNVIAVGAINNRSERAAPFCWGGGSNYGDHIDFMAPGERIYGLSHQNPNGYSIYCGTSQAAPHVSGVIMLLLAANPSLNFSQVYNLLKAGAHDQIGPPAEDTPGWDRYYGWGRVDALASLTQLVTGLAERRPGQPQGFQLLQNYPNPFNPATTIEYRIDQPGHVSLVIYNVTGQRVRTLVDEWQPAGHYRVTWDGFSDRQVFSVPAGVYFYELKRGDRVARKRLILLR